MHTIDTIADLVRVLKEEPEWAEALRNQLLSQELLELPARFQAFVRVTEENNRLMRERLDRVESDIRDLKAGQAETNQRLGQLTGEVDQLTGQVNQLTGEVNQMRGQIGNLVGADLERKVHANVSHFARRLKLRKIRILQSQFIDDNKELHDRLAHAEDQGIISLEQGDQIQVDDIIFRGQHRESAQSMHVVAEVSRSIADHDIVRAADRAQIWSLVTECETLAVVIGARIEPKQQALAQERSVTILIHKALEAH